MKNKTQKLMAGLVGGVLLLSGGASMAQPNSMSANQFGDRQSGNFGDPSQGHFGNAAEGHFDTGSMTEPPPGTPSLGRVSSKAAADGGAYVSLDKPSEGSAKAEKPAPARKTVRSKKKAAQK